VVSNIYKRIYTEEYILNGHVCFGVKMSNWMTHYYFACFHSNIFLTNPSMIDLQKSSLNILMKWYAVVIRANLFSRTRKLCFFFRNVNWLPQNFLLIVAHLGNPLEWRRFVSYWPLSRNLSIWSSKQYWAVFSLRPRSKHFNRFEQKCRKKTEIRQMFLCSRNKETFRNSYGELKL